MDFGVGVRTFDFKSFYKGSKSQKISRAKADIFPRVWKINGSIAELSRNKFPKKFFQKIKDNFCKKKDRTFFTLAEIV